LERAERAVVAGGDAAKVVMVTRGKGTIAWSPLPVELAESIDPTVGFYRWALAQAGVKPAIAVERGAPGFFVGANQFGSNWLVALASEAGEDREVVVTHTPSGKRHTVALPSGRAMLLWLDGKTGALVDRSHPPAW